MSEFPNVKLVYASRKNNVPAHAAAKLALDIHGCKVWFTDVPKNLVKAVYNDLMK